MSLNLPALIAHRGLNAKAPENTLAAFQLAETAGFTWFECDVQLSQDDVPFIFHDDELARTTNGTGQFIHKHSAYLQALDAGIWFGPQYANTRIPTLVALLDGLLGNSLCLNLELKGSQTHLAAVVSQVLQPYLPKLRNRILISSFEYKALVDFKAQGLNLPLALLIDLPNFLKWGYVGITRRFKALDAYCLNVVDRLINSSSATRFLKISPRVLVYTVNDLARAEELFQQGITGVFTDTLLPRRDKAQSAAIQ